MAQPVRFTRVLSGLPADAPFTGPETLERRSGKRFTLRLGANESGFGPSPLAREAMIAAVGRIAHYADPECYELRAAVAALYGSGVGTEHVVVAGGIDELLGLVVRAFLEHGEVAVTSRGAYPTFNYHVTGYGGRLEIVPYRDDRNDLQALADTARRARAKLVYLANPDNPSGTWFEARDLAAFREALPDDCLLLLDEAYVEFAPAGAALPVDAADPRVIHLRTFSKAYGMAGARIGYAVATPETIAAFDKIRLHFGVNLVAQAGALAALGDATFLADICAEVARGRDEYAALAREVGLRPIPSATNFVAMETGSAQRSLTIVDALAARGVFARRPGAAPLDRWVRVTVGTAAERAAFAAVIREVWAGLGGMRQV